MAYQNQKVKARQVVTQTKQIQTLGVVANVPMGDWNASTEYLKLNTVRSHGATYQAKKSNRGVEPTVTQGWKEVWQVVAYDGNTVMPTGTYPEMTVGKATQADNDGMGNNIAEQFTAVNSDIQGLREDITNEAHFRGYLATNAEIQALSATPNDYAYSAESGTVWIYQTGTGWTNSGKPVPDQTVPASNATPLMAGTANAGTSTDYARGDHRHPTDTSRASTAVATRSSNGLMSAADKTKLDGLSTSGVTGVKGNTESTYRAGDVNLTPQNIGSVDKKGDAMTGALEVPLILGKGATDDAGIIPVRYITRQELAVSTSDGVDVYLQAWLKKVCELYPNHKDCIFIGNGNPSSKMIIQAFIYNTSEVNAQGAPRYATGFCKQFATDILYFNVNEYVLTTGWTRGGEPYSNNNRPTAGAFKIGQKQTNQTDTVIEYYAISNGKAWYRKWASGFIEQGGTITTNNNATTNISFYPEFSTALLSLTSSYLTSKARDNPMVVREYSLTGFTVSNKAGTDDTAVSWYACGY